jgi:L-lactate dehydrogenase complex protein LldG
MPPDLLRRLRGRFRIAAMPEPGVTDGPTGVVGLTGALAAIAETGTLALPGGRGRPLSASLLPEVHIAILRASDIYQNLPQALRLREVQGASATALISGPSRTADIEMSLTIGMHGPKEVHVICVK